MKTFFNILSGLILATTVPAVAQDSLDFSKVVEVRKVLNNSVANASFTPYGKFKTRTLATLSGFKGKSIKTNKYGGRSDRKEKATGFYHTKKINGRWWAIIHRVIFFYIMP